MLAPTFHSSIQKGPDTLNPFFQSVQCMGTSLAAALFVFRLIPYEAGAYYNENYLTTIPTDPQCLV